MPIIKIYNGVFLLDTLTRWRFSCVLIDQSIWTRGNFTVFECIADNMCILYTSVIWKKKKKWN